MLLAASRLPRRLALATSALLSLALAACGDTSPAESSNPTPGIERISPDAVEEGSSGIVVTVTGSDFVRASVVRVNGADRPTTYISTSELRATLPSSDFAAAGQQQVTVVNPTPGGGTSNGVMMQVSVRTNPAPVVTGVSPAFTTAGAPATIVTLQGTGFVSTSRVYSEFTERTDVTVVSPTAIRVTLSAAELATGKVIPLRVQNPGPGGGLSGNAQFEVRTPAPTLVSLGTTQADAGLPSLTVRLTGSNFVQGSTVQFNQSPRPTTFVDATKLDVLLGEGDLRAAGTFQLAVTNPGPGGGTSGALPLTLVNGVPALTLLPSQAAHAGRPGFSLYVHGRGFVQGSTVRWNGAARPTQYLSGSRLQADITAADVASAATVQITVSNPTPGGGASAPMTFTVRPVPSPTATESRVVKLEGRDLAWDEGTGRLYLSIGGTAQADANSVVAVDPTSGAVTGRVFVGSNPNRLARSTNGQYLYVGLDGAAAVRRVSLATLAAGLQFSLPASNEVAGEIEAVPGRPGSVAITLQVPFVSPPLAGVAIYDDGTRRPTMSPDHTGGNRIAFLDSPDVLYGYNNAHTGFEFFTIGVDASGARHAAVTSGLISGFYTQITGAAGRIYGTDGSIVDAERRVRIGTLPAGSNASLADPVAGRAYLVVDAGIAVYDLNNFQLLGTVPVSGMGFDHPAIAKTRLVRWGSDGLAFLDMDELFIVRSPMFAR